MFFVLVFVYIMWNEIIMCELLFGWKFLLLLIVLVCGEFDIYFWFSSVWCVVLYVVLDLVWKVCVYGFVVVLNCFC